MVKQYSGLGRCVTKSFGLRSKVVGENHGFESHQNAIFPRNFKVMTNLAEGQISVLDRLISHHFLNKVK